MTTQPLPAVPDEFGPNDPVVTFGMLECRTCGERSDWVRTDHSVALDAILVWDVDHQEATGHAKYYQWTISRNTAQLYRL